LLVGDDVGACDGKGTPRKLRKRFVEHYGSGGGYRVTECFQCRQNLRDSLDRWSRVEELRTKRRNRVAKWADD
jgi:hypothetical protein